MGDEERQDTAIRNTLNLITVHMTEYIVSVQYSTVQYSTVRYSTVSVCEVIEMGNLSKYRATPAQYAPGP